jgi:hypothetical protein
MIVLALIFSHLSSSMSSLGALAVSSEVANEQRDHLQRERNGTTKTGAWQGQFINRVAS